MLLWIAVVILIAIFSVWIYRTERGAAHYTLRWLLAIVRGSLLLLVVWMITGWSWQRARVELPELVIAVDVSDSMLTGDGQGELSSGDPMNRLARAQQLLALPEEQWKLLREQYRVRTYLVAQDAMQLEIDSNLSNLQERAGLVGDRQTLQQSLLGDALIRIIEGQAGRGTAAIVFLSDGILTSGQSLTEVGQRARRAAIPIHSVTIGRRQPQPDLRIGDILTENQVYLGDQVNVEATIVASDVDESIVKAQLIESASGQVVDEQTVQMKPTESQVTVTLRYVPKQPGAMGLQVVVQQIPNESDTANNKTEIQLQVQDRVIRVLMVFSQPSYEFRFLKHFLERTTQTGTRSTATFELTSVLQNGDPEYVQQDNAAQRFVPSDPAQLSQIDVFIFGPLDASLIPNSSQQVIVRSITHGGSGAVFLGATQDPIQQLARHPLGILLPIQSTLPEVQYAPQGFQIESTNIGQSSLPFPWNSPLNETPGSQSQLPALQSLLGVDTVKPGAQVLANAVSIPDGGRSPLIVTQFAGAGRTCFLATDETFRWTTTFGSDQAHQQFWGQLLRWLCRSKLNSLDDSELKAEPKQAKLGSPIRLQLKLPVGEGHPSNAELRIEGQAGFQRTVSLPQTPGTSATYQGTVDQLTTGAYRAVVVQPAMANPPAVEFSMIAPQVEQANLRADVESMKQLAETSRGKAYSADEAQQWFRDLPPGQSLRLGNLPPQPIWNQPWVAMLFIGLLATEWLLRRRARML